MIDILLTADKSVMNDFHLKGRIAFPFYGSGEMFPNWLFNLLVAGPKHDFGLIKFAPYPLRKIEASLLDADFNVLTVSPDYLKNYIDEAKILGIHTVDPLGFGSKPFFYEKIKGSVQYSTKYFKELIEQPCIKDAKKKGLKVIVGGEGAWQLKKSPGLSYSEIIDHIVIGEGEIVVPKLCKDILDRKSISRYIETTNTTKPMLDNISTIRKASNFGCIEIGRGCNRHCKFCEVTKSNLIWYPFNKIEDELKINKEEGLKRGIIHAEDVFLYGQNGFIPDNEKMIKLFKLIYKYYNEFVITHFSLAAVQSNRSLFKKLMEIVLEHQNFFIGEAGIETASTELMKKTMSGKVLPFKNKEWHNIIKDSLGLIHDYNFIPYCSLIIGLPYENNDDVIKTINLIDDLKDIRCIFLPSEFTPLGVYSDNDVRSSKINTLIPVRKELVDKCLDHNARWVTNIADIILEKDDLYRGLSKIWYFQTILKSMLKKSNKSILKTTEKIKDEKYHSFPTNRHPSS